MRAVNRVDSPRGSLARLVEGSIRKSAQIVTKASLFPFRSTGSHIVRYSMYQELEEVFRDLTWETDPQALPISGSAALARRACPNASVTEADYPEHNFVDLKFDDNSFDLVVSDQVLEHVEGDPFQAVRESHRILKPGGIAVHTTVMLFQIHGYPSDFWRYTPDCLKMLCRDFDQILACDGWGNRYMPLLNWLGLIEGFPVPASSLHPYNYFATHNEWRYPVVTWVVARK